MNAYEKLVHYLLFGSFKSEEEALEEVVGLLCDSGMAEETIVMGLMIAQKTRPTLQKHFNSLLRSELSPDEAQDVVDWMNTRTGKLYANLMLKVMHSGPVLAKEFEKLDLLGD